MVFLFCIFNVKYFFPVYISATTLVSYTLDLFWMLHLLFKQNNKIRLCTQFMAWQKLLSWNSELIAFVCRELVDLMQAGTLEPEVAFLNASLVRASGHWINTSSFYTFYMSWYYQFYLRQIPDVFPVLAAAYKTLIAKSRDSLTTRTLHSELVYNYSGSKHVTNEFA